jgi:polyisoprenyl-phosphate glycosyltransferase
MLGCHDSRFQLRYKAPIWELAPVTSGTESRLTEAARALRGAAPAPAPAPAPMIAPAPVLAPEPGPAAAPAPPRHNPIAAQGLSIVVPLHNEAASLARLHERLLEVAQGLGARRALPCELVYVDDGSRDDTLAIAHTLPADGLDLQIVSLSRNFGKEAALLAGLDHARLGAVVFIDGDGQHPPAMIEAMVDRWLDERYDVVFTAKAHRSNESIVRRVLVKGFYKLLNWGARTSIPEDAGDFRLLSPRAADALRRLPERNRFFKGLSSWIGFRQIRIDYQPEPRTEGRSTWNLRSLIGLSIDGLTGFSVAPLRVATLLGLILALTAFVYGGEIVYETLVYGGKVPGYPSLFVGLMVLGGVQLIMLGVLGEYIGKILSEIKGRPVYFIAEHSIKQRQDNVAAASETRTAAE